jgi:hypothetical protein
MASSGEESGGAAGEQVGADEVDVGAGAPRQAAPVFVPVNRQ